MAFGFGNPVMPAPAAGLAPAAPSVGIPEATGLAPSPMVGVAPAQPAFRQPFVPGAQGPAQFGFRQPMVDPRMAAIRPMFRR